MGLVLRVAVALSVGAGGTAWERGIAARYDPGVMERVADNRGMTRERCMIASPFHSIGTWVAVEGVRTGRRRLCRVTDTSAPKDKARHVAKRMIELDYNSAKDICGSVRIAPRDCPVKWRIAVR